ncbi:ABC transporter ATP-binding protein/permease [Candidatus Izimaplasma bacterium]|nr:ABC transporter ATP-binding protein/permease [Candidatus Izimaplasma bacterium]
MSSLLKTLQYTLKYWQYILISLTAMTINVATGFVVPYLMVIIIDDAIPNGDYELLWQTGGLMVIVALFGLLLAIINIYSSQKVAMWSIADLREDLFRKIQSLSFTNVDKFKTSRLITTATSDMARIQQFFSMLLRIIVRAPLMFGIGLFMAIQTSTALSNIFYASLPVLLITIVVVMIVATPRFMKVPKTVDGLNKASLETANSPRVIKSFVSMKQENKKFNKANELFRVTNTAAEKVMAVAEPFIMMIFNMTLAGLIFLGAYYFKDGTLLEVGTGLPKVGILMAFSNYSMQILFGLLMFAMIMIFMTRAIASSKRIIEVMEEVVDLQNCEDCIDDFDINGQIEFKNVSFAYGKDANEVLKRISFKIKPGERVGIIGSTGSGKSSIINLIPRLYDVKSGAVLIDNINVKKYSIENLRSQISVVTQTATIFSGSVGTNLLQGNKDASIEDLDIASESAQASEFINEYDDVYNHEVQQNGTNLSGGQKQRISLARAFLRKPKILILDDSTSAVDAQSEVSILNEIERLSNNMTTLLIAQKISTVSQMDRILVLNNKGSIDGYDTHENLMKNSKVYQEIALSQVGGGADA